MYIDHHSINRNLARFTGRYVIRKTMSSAFFGHLAWFVYPPDEGHYEYEMASHRQALMVVRNQLDKKRKANEAA